MILKCTKTNFWKVAFGFLLVMLSVLNVSIPLGASPDANNVNAANAVIRGRVVNENGKPVAGALVRLDYIYTLNEQPAVTKTDEEGWFQFEMESKYVSPWLIFHAVTEDQTLLGNGQIKFVEGVATIPEIAITLEPARVITGTVVDQNGQPVKGATVAGVDQITYPNLVTTDTEGKFRLAYPKELRPLQEVYAFKEGVGFDYLCTEELDTFRGVTPPEKISNGPFLLTLLPIKPVEIKVVNKKREPLPGVEVGVWLIRKQNEKDCFNACDAPDFFTSRTNAEGIARLECLPEWAVERTCYTAYGPSEGVLQADGTRVFYGSDHKRMEEFSMLQAVSGIIPSNIVRGIRNYVKGKNDTTIPTFILPLQARVTGTVKLPDGTPVPWTIITRKNHAACGHGIRFTDANGEFELYENANQLLDLAVDHSKFGATPGVFAFDVGDGSTVKTLDFVLEKGIRLHGTVYGLDGQPADKTFHVFIYENDPNPEPCTPDGKDCPDGGCPVGIVIRQTSNYKPDVLDGKYEYILPAVTRSYSINADLYGAEGRVSHEFALLGDEEEYELDLYLKAEESER